MTAATSTYARKSTTQDVADEQRSVARQVEHARADAAYNYSRVSALLVLMAFLSAVTGIAQEKVNPNRQWLDGTWGDTERVSRYAGSMSNGTVDKDGSVYGHDTPVYHVSQQFVIETADRWYVASQRLRWKWNKPVPMTVNAAAKFAIEKDKIYVIGEDQKEYELTIVKKGLKLAEKPAPTAAPPHD